MIQPGDKIKIKKTYESDFGVTWPVYEVRIIHDRKITVLCKCTAENTSDQESGLKKAELIRDVLIQANKDYAKIQVNKPNRN